MPLTYKGESTGCLPAWAPPTGTLIDPDLGALVSSCEDTLAPFKACQSQLPFHTSFQASLLHENVPIQSTLSFLLILLGVEGKPRRGASAAQPSFL